MDRGGRTFINDQRLRPQPPSNSFLILPQFPDQHIWFFQCKSNSTKGMKRNATDVTGRNSSGRGHSYRFMVVGVFLLQSSDDFSQ